MIFIANKYTTVYYKIIESAKSRPSDYYSYNETHHIIPESFFVNRTRKGAPGWLEGNPNDPNNLVNLSAREHLICHKLLVKMTSGDARVKMVRALWGMCNLENKGQSRKKINARQYELLRREFSSMHSVLMRERNPMKDPDVKRIHQEAIIKRGKTRGRTGIKASLETREKMSNSNKGQHVPEEKRLAASIFHSNRPEHVRDMYYMRHSNSVCCIHCKKSLNPGLLSRWHGDNCKIKPSN